MQLTKSQYLLLRELRNAYAKGRGEIPSPLSRETVLSALRRYLPHTPWHRAVRDLSGYVTITENGRYRVRKIPELKIADLPGDWPIGTAPPPSDAVFADGEEAHEPVVEPKMAPPIPPEPSAPRQRPAKAVSKPDPRRPIDSPEQEDRILADVVALQECSVGKAVAPKVLAALFDSRYPNVDRRLWKDRNRQRTWVRSTSGFGGNGLTCATQKGLAVLSARGIVSGLSPEDRDALLAHDPRLKYVKTRRAA